MRVVSNLLRQRREHLRTHPFFAWFNDESLPLADRFAFSPIMVEFIMGFADMNKWFLAYPEPKNALQEAINEHTDEDRTHSRLFIEDWVKLGLNWRLGWSPSETLWWWFVCSETETIRRLAMEALALTVQNPDPLVRFPMMEAIEECGDVFFGNTVSAAKGLGRKTGIEYRYYGEYHRVRETGHLHTDEDAFMSAELDPVQRAQALRLVDRMYDMFVEELDMVLDYSKRVTVGPAKVAAELRAQFQRQLERKPTAGRWPAGPSYEPNSEGLSTVQRALKERVDRLRKHGLVSWLRSDQDFSALHKLRRFTPLWAIDILGYADFNQFVLRYREPSGPEERAINRWTEELASHNILYLKDWVALGLDDMLGWLPHQVIDYYFLGDHTEIHRHAMARAKHLAFTHTSPQLRFWLMRALESGSEVLFRAVKPLVEQVEGDSDVRLDYWGHRHYLVQPELPADDEADAVDFAAHLLSAEEERAALEIITVIFDNFERQFSLSLEVARQDFFTRSGAAAAYLGRSAVVDEKVTLAIPDPNGNLSIVSSYGAAATLAGAAASDFAGRISGGVLREGQAGYEEARHVWNGRIDRKPALIARCLHSEDVALAVRFARTHNILVSVRGGGHNVGGTAVCERGLMIDLSGMKAIRVDAEARRVVVEPGVRWKELDTATQPYGLAVPGGQHSEVGVAGYTLGGGIGWMARKYGMGIDSLKSVQIVTADGALRTASEQENADLFWAVRGGGGNFGIVTSFEFELRQVGPTVLAGLVIHPVSRAREALRFFREFSGQTPDDVHVVAVLMAMPPTGQKAVAFAVCHDGPVEQGEQALAPLRAFGPPLVDQVQTMPYVVLQGMMDRMAPAGRHYANRSRFMKSLDDRALSVAVNHFIKSPSPGCTVFFHRLGGAMARVPVDATAFAHRDAEFCLVVEAGWPDDLSASDAHRSWVSRLTSALEPYTMGAAYLNDLGLAVAEGRDEIRAAYGSNYPRLARIKAKYDPSNFFSHNQNVEPTSGVTP
jgi:FAD/FMN-containing dehydrogenase